MADLTSRLNLVRAQQAQKEIVINSLFNAMSPSAFGGKNETASNGLVWGIYGGSNGSVIIANTTITLQDNTTQYLSFNNSTASFELSTTTFGDFPCYLIVTSNGIATDWKDYRPFSGGGSGGGSDPSFKSSGVPDVSPVTSGGDNSIAIGTGSVSSGYHSFALLGGEATVQESFAYGRNSKCFSRFSITMGKDNRIESGEQSLNLGGEGNTISAQGENNNIIGSNYCAINSSAYNLSLIINSRFSEVSSRNSTLLSANNSVIKNYSEYSLGWGNEASVYNSYTFQMAFTKFIKKQFTGLTVLTTDDSEQNLQIGTTSTVIRNFKIEDNQVLNLKVTLIGVDDSFNCVKFETDVLVKRYNSISSLIGETSSTEKDLNLIVSESDLSDTTSKIKLDNEYINVSVKGISAKNIRWSAIFDSQILQTV